MDSDHPRRWLALWALLACLTRTAWAAESPEKYSLQSHRSSDELSRVEVALEVGGELKFAGEPVKTLPMSVLANLNYDERIVELDPIGRPSASLRYYDDVRAVIKVDKGGERPTLDRTHRLIAAVKPEASPAILFCPSDPLSRDELDLIDSPGNSLLMDLLLPEGPVAAGESWKLSDDTLCQLLGLDAVGWSEVQSVLGEINGDVAEIAAAGTLSGAVGGVPTEIEVKAKYRFDLTLKRVTYLALLIKEKRAVGHVGPGLETVAKLIVKITPLAASQYLARHDLPIVSSALPPEMAQLQYRAAAGTFRFNYDRNWFIINDDPKLAILRLMDRGERVAQCNISPLPVLSKPVTLAEFQHDVQTSLGKNFGQFLAASQSTNEAGYTVMRVVVSGIVSQVPIEWVYYLVFDGRGRRVSLAFTYEQSLAEQFAGADRAIVNQLRLTEPPSPTAAKPVQTK